MTFKADQQAIRDFGSHLGGLADDAESAVSYARNHLSIGYDRGRMFFTVVETATTVREALVANYTTLGRIATQSATEITKAANLYRDTDSGAAARLDAAY